MATHEEVMSHPFATLEGVRILHTSDWHLGRAFHGSSLIDEQEQAVRRIVEMARFYKIDLAVIAGDIYDRAWPPVEAVALFEDSLVALRETGARVVAITGNHDSAERVGVRDRLLESAGLTVRGDAARCGQPLILSDLADEGPPVAVYPVPYLDPATTGSVLIDPSEVAVDGVASHTHQDVAAAATSLARAHMESIDPVRTVLVAHTFIQDGEESDSERALSVGHIDRVRPSTFDGFDYVALGHLHRPQRCSERVVYSGSPLPYSFSEEGHEKSVRIVEMGADSDITIETVALGVGRPLRTLQGSFESLLASAAHEGAEDARVRFQITDTHLPQQAMSRLQQRFPHAVELAHTPPFAPPAQGAGRAADNDPVKPASPMELAAEFWRAQVGEDPSPEVCDAMSEAFDATLRAAA